MSYKPRKPTYAAARLGQGTLARFGGRGLDWGQIHALDPATPAGWWRGAIVRAEDDGVLAWDRHGRRWCLTDAGRAAVRMAA